MRVTARTVTEYLDQAPEPTRSEVWRLHRLIRATVPTHRPFLSSGTVGYGPHHYRYASGREGDTFVVGLADRRRSLALYLNAVVDGEHRPETNAKAARQTPPRRGEG